MAPVGSIADQAQSRNGIKKRILFVTFDFPPRRTSAVYRHVGLNRYLGRYGWLPTILTAQAPHTEAWDPTLLERFPSEIAVVRTAVIPLAGWEAPAGTAIRRLGALKSAAGDVKQGWLDRSLRSLAEVFQSIAYFPDKTAGWIPIASVKALQLVMEKRFHLVYTSSPPRSAPVVGLLVKLLTGTPWIAEFRDPWYPPQHPIRRRLERWLMARILHKADAVVLISEGLADEMHRGFGVSRSKLHIVSNGFDEMDFASGTEARDSAFAPGFVHLSHFGTVYPRFSGEFFRALSALLQEMPSLRHRLRVNIVGFPDEEVLELKNADPILRDVIQVYGFMQHRKAIQAMASSDCLLLFLANAEVSRLSGLGKIYWYLRAGRPILAVTPNGGTKTILEESGAGWAVEPNDTQAIKEIVRRLASKAENDQMPKPVSADFLAQFRYDKLAGRLGEILDRVSS